jgi:hypothetical protein
LDLRTVASLYWIHPLEQKKTWKKIKISALQILGAFTVFR